ncbi:VapE domain-containing protein [Falsiroseomonas tokyonensis]|uniref:Primase-helicase family protein n=1 Tax=Falsiroseomonas tokyonensis TaxID=430521 RepID=A0ABV7C5U3_9PROT|nr:VapE domain-containing protein [Falsiroseomonas tokyonensis]MBU8542019.1 hypothetical protein [Falsiroseomonas tokyonensis]
MNMIISDGTAVTSNATLLSCATASSSANFDYAAFIAEKKRDLLIVHASGESVDADLVVEGLISGKPENQAIRDFAVRTLGIKKAEIDTALKRLKVRAALGRYPDGVSDYIGLYVQKHAIEVQANGGLTSSARVFFEADDGTKIFPSDEDLRDPAVAEKVRFSRKVDRAVTSLQERLRVEASDLGLSFPAQVINDAVSLWRNDSQHLRVGEIYRTISRSSPPEAAAARTALVDLCARCFEHNDSCTPEYIAAIFLKFVWQVKRKMMGKSVTRHLMPVLLGPSGTGKTTFVDLLISPVSEVSLPTDFTEITDNRNVSLWKSYVLVLDEMGRATKADVDVVKNVITAARLTRRVLGSNHHVDIDNCATLIGTANAANLADLIRDHTGIRRFAPLNWRPDAERHWDAVNRMNWLDVWRAVSIDDPDPLLPFSAILAAQQEEHREKSPVEHWLDNLNPKKWLSGALQSRTKFAAAELYADFREHEDTAFPGQKRTTETGWGNEMGRLIRAGVSPFDKKRTAAGVAYEWSPLRGAADVVGR